MKILVISDVHGNIIASEEVLRIPHDTVVFAGDIVDYGPRPKECLHKLKDVSYKIVRGNHDNAAGLGTDCHCSPKMHDLSVKTRVYTRSVLNREDLEFLAKLPLREQFEIDGKHFYMVHASKSDPLFKYLDPRKIGISEIEKEFEDINADFIIYGHTHIPVLIKRKKGGFILNPGSAGQPRDGDWRASCAVIDTFSNSVEFKRVAYDIDTVEKDITEKKLPERLIRILRQEE